MAAALCWAAAVSCARRPARVNYSLFDRSSEEEITEPQYRVANEPGGTLVSIFAGQKPTGGYSVEITGVDRVANTCVVRYRIEGPGPDAIVPQVLTYPDVTVRISPACPDVEVDPPLRRIQVK
jgi:hypothetical protein